MALLTDSLVCVESAEPAESSCIHHRTCVATIISALVRIPVRSSSEIPGESPGIIVFAKSCWKILRISVSGRFPPIAGGSKKVLRDYLMAPCMWQCPRGQDRPEHPNPSFLNYLGLDRAVTVLGSQSIATNLSKDFGSSPTHGCHTSLR